MDEKALKLVAKIISKAGPELPADAALREEFRKQTGLSREMTREISKAVFAYFRWLGWLPAGMELKEMVPLALELGKKFSNNPDSFTDDELIEKAVPAWIKKQIEVSPKWVRALQSEPKLWLRTKKNLRNKIAERLIDCRVREEWFLNDAIEYYGNEDLFRTEEFQAGEFEMQDISSQAVSVICDPQPGQTWWDACAGEGGKMLHLSELMQNKGLIWASDRAAWRLKRLKQRAARAKAFNYRAELWDGSAKLPTKTKFDGILVDAPCSGVGTWQRNPHARWTTSLNDVEELAAIQCDLLSHVANSLKVGGRLVYSVCTLTRAETVDVMNFFSEQHKNFEMVAVKNPFQPDATEQSQNWFWPQESGGNGMFTAVWKRTS